MRHVTLLLLFSSHLAVGQPVDLPHVLTNNSVADAEQVMANFNALKEGVNSRVSVDLNNHNVVVGDGMQSVTPGTPESNNGTENTAVGSATLQTNTTGSNNTAMGARALNDNVTGNDNTASGYSALYSNESGDENTAEGAYALHSNTSGYWNTAIGFKSLEGNRLGWRNTAVGWQSLSNNTGINNTAVGADALYQHTTGEGNTALGNKALDTNTTGQYNTAVGHNADVGTADLENATALGHYAIVNASNTVQLGNDRVTSVATYGKLTTGTVTYPNTHGATGQVLGTNGSGELAWLNIEDIAKATDSVSMQKRIESLENQLKVQQEELLALVESQEKQMAVQQEQIAQLQRMVQHQFASN